MLYRLRSRKDIGASGVKDCCVKREYACVCVCVCVAVSSTMAVDVSLCVDLLSCTGPGVALFGWAARRGSASATGSSTCVIACRAQLSNVVWSLNVRVGIVMPAYSRQCSTCARVVVEY